VSIHARRIKHHLYFRLPTKVIRSRWNVDRQWFHVLKETLNNLASCMLDVCRINLKKVLLCNSAIWQLTHFLIYAAQTLFYFPQNVVCIINFFFVKILLKFYINGALKFKWPILSVKGNVTFFQFLYIFMFLWRCTSVLQCCYHSFHYRNKCCLCVLLNIEHIIKNITIESHTAHCLPYNS